MGEGEWWEDIGSRIDCKSYDTTHHIVDHNGLLSSQ